MTMSSIYLILVNIAHRETSNTSHTLAGNKIVDQSNVILTLLVDAVSTASLFSTQLLDSMD